MNEVSGILHGLRYRLGDADTGTCICPLNDAHTYGHSHTHTHTHTNTHNEYFHTPNTNTAKRTHKHTHIRTLSGTVYTGCDLNTSIEDMEILVCVVVAVCCWFY